jgi:hypothetical protein
MQSGIACRLLQACHKGEYMIKKPTLNNIVLKSETCNYIVKRIETLLHTTDIAGAKPELIAEILFFIDKQKQAKETVITTL